MRSKTEARIIGILPYLRNRIIWLLPAMDGSASVFP